MLTGVEMQRIIDQVNAAFESKDKKLAELEERVKTLEEAKVVKKVTKTTSSTT